MTNQTPTKSDERHAPRTSILDRRTFLSAAGGVGASALAGCLGSSNHTANFETGDDAERLRDAASSYLDTATLYKAPYCSCCLEYRKYLEATTGVRIDVVKVTDLAKTKEKYNVPRDVESCHTMDTGEYYVEGHVPREAIGKLAEVTPDIAGIALPGMPLGSPGMPGEKSEAFVVYAVSGDGSFDEFMTI